jgi:crotonobetainyl-CoA:carnitine CoA-transferase CaiB-like acyl-CoA transferase
VQGAPVAAGAHTRAALADWGFAADDVDELLRSGAIA